MSPAKEAAIIYHPFWLRLRKVFVEQVSLDPKQHTRIMQCSCWESERSVDYGCLLGYNECEGQQVLFVEACQQA